MVLTRVVHQVGVAIAVCVGRVLQRHARGPTRCCQPESEPRESMSPTIRNFAFTLVTVALVAGCANRSDSALMPPPDDSWSPAINASATGGGLPPPSAAPAAPAPRDPWPRDVTFDRRRCTDLPTAGRLVDRQYARMARCRGAAAHRPEGRDLWRRLGYSAHRRRPRNAHGRAQRRRCHEEQLPDAVGQGCAVSSGPARRVGERAADDGARQPRGVARGLEDRSADPRMRCATRRRRSSSPMGWRCWCR